MKFNGNGTYFRGQKKIIKQMTGENLVTSRISVYYYDFWRSCDTEDWSYDAENSAVHHKNVIVQYIDIENRYFKL